MNDERVLKLVAACREALTLIDGEDWQERLRERLLEEGDSFVAQIREQLRRALAGA